MQQFQYGYITDETTLRKRCQRNNNDKVAFRKAESMGMFDEDGENSLDKAAEICTEIIQKECEDNNAQQPVPHASLQSHLMTDIQQDVSKACAEKDEPNFGIIYNELAKMNESEMPELRMFLQKLQQNANSGHISTASSSSPRQQEINEQSSIQHASKVCFSAGSSNNPRQQQFNQVQSSIQHASQVCGSKLSSNSQSQQHVNHQQTSIQHTSQACANTSSSNIPRHQEVSQPENSIHLTSHTPLTTPGFPQATDGSLESFVPTGLPGILPEFEFTEHVLNKPAMNQEAYFLHRNVQPLQFQTNIQQQPTVSRFFINDSEGNPVVITLPNDAKFITMPGPPERNSIIVSAAETCEKEPKFGIPDIPMLSPELVAPKTPEVFVMEKCSEQITAMKGTVMNDHSENQINEKQIKEQKNSEMAEQQTEQENDLKKKTINQSDENPVVETKPNDNTASSNVSKNEEDLGGNDETEKFMQQDLNVLNHNVSTGPEQEESTGVRQRFVNYFDETFKKHNAVLIQKGKTVLPLYELCRSYLGLNNDICLAMSSYMKMNAYFKKFHSTGNNNITKTQKEEVVIIQISPEGFYPQPKEERKDQDSESETEGTGATMKRSKSVKGTNNEKI